MKTTTTRLLASIAILAAAAVGLATQDGKGKYAQVNGLKMYYEIHGTGKPLVLLHGAFGTAEGWAMLLPALSKNRQVIIIEQQGHGRTADIDRPLTYQQMAKDTAALLKQLNIKDADVFGYSMGGSTALELASKNPELVRKLVILGAGSGPIKETYAPEIYQQFKSITPENFDFPQVKDPYVKVAPDPSKWPVLVSKVTKLDAGGGMPVKDVKSIRAHTLIMMGDRDAVKPEHAVEMLRMIPNSQLAIFPGGDHFLPFTSPDKVLAFLVPFLDAPGPAQTTGGGS
ncbi:MAG: alpha/beta hydrolase [Chlorobia bacterium]|nr:alpha/beta hydrolase [Fimbriimonadaceae bacterium]